MSVPGINTSTSPITSPLSSPSTPSTPNAALTSLLSRNSSSNSHTRTLMGGPVPSNPAMPKITEVNDPSTYSHDELLKFYRGEIANIFGFSIQDMQNFSMEVKEKEHKYIQWMWPISAPSGAQPGAKGPVINEEIGAKFQQDPIVVTNARNSLISMLTFYGLQIVGGTISKAANFEEMEANWCPGGPDHNHPRLTRILESLHFFGLVNEAQALFNCLKSLWVEKPERFSDQTLKFWCDKTGNSWDIIQLEAHDILEERQIEFTLDNLITAKKKTHWILADLSVCESSKFGRVMWAIIKLCKCLRSLFYDIDLDASHQRWMEITRKIVGTENPRLRRLTDKWRAAAENFNTIIGPKHQFMTTVKFNNLTLVVKPGDITKEPADVIVNAANERILGGSGVDHAIHKAGGPDIKKDCIAIRAMRKQMNRPEDNFPGESVLTTAGNLPATHVAHTVGPRWRGGNKKEEETLYHAYTNTLDQVAAQDLKTVNFPSISTGVFSFPLNKAAPVMVQALKDYADRNSSVQKVSMVVFEPEQFLAYSMAAKT